jgi:hypothetical protein
MVLPFEWPSATKIAEAGAGLLMLWHLKQRAKRGNARFAQAVICISSPSLIELANTGTVNSRTVVISTVEQSLESQ